MENWRITYNTCQRNEWFCLSKNRSSIKHILEICKHNSEWYNVWSILSSWTYFSVYSNENNCVYFTARVNRKHFTFVINQLSILAFVWAIQFVSNAGRSLNLYTCQKLLLLLLLLLQYKWWKWNHPFFDLYTFNTFIPATG